MTPNRWSPPVGGREGKEWGRGRPAGLGHVGEKGRGKGKPTWAGPRGKKKRKGEGEGSGPGQKRKREKERNAFKCI
jgi:hypothetical protein